MIIWLLVQKLLPLYFLILLGFIGGRYLDVSTEMMGKLLIYLVLPAVAFTSILQTPLTPARLSIPIFFFILCTCLGLCAHLFGKRFFPRSSTGVLSYACGSGNTGYFGIPLTQALLGPEYLGLAILSALGFVLYENTLGFYFAFRSKYSARSSVRKVLLLPALHATGLAILLNLLGVKDTQWMGDLPQHFRGAYSVFGMFLLGIGIGKLSHRKFDFAFWGVGLGFKYIAWPIAVAVCLRLDSNVFHFFDFETRRTFVLMSIVPLPAISVAMAAMLNQKPAETALLVFSSTVIALLYIPLYITVFPF